MPRRRCCNPYHLQRHPQNQSTRKVGKDEDRLRSKFPNANLTSGSYICESCRFRTRHDDSLVVPTALGPTVFDILLPRRMQPVVQLNRTPMCPLPQPSTGRTDGGNIENTGPQAGTSSRLYPTLQTTNSSVTLDQFELHHSVAGNEESTSSDTELSLQSNINPADPTSTSSSGNDVISSDEQAHANSNGTPVSQVSDFMLEKLNRKMSVVDSTISPLTKGDRHKPYRIKKKLFEMDNAIVQSLKGFAKKVFKGLTTKEESCKDCEFLVGCLKERLLECETKRERMQCLTCTPLSMSIAKIEAEFCCTAYEAREASKLKNSIGSFSHTRQHKGRPVKITDSIKQLVVQFYLDDDHSRVDPGLRSTRIVDGVIVPKRRLLFSLNDLYQLFISGQTDTPNVDIDISVSPLGTTSSPYSVGEVPINISDNIDNPNTDENSRPSTLNPVYHSRPEQDISLSYFARLRPKNCIWPGLTGNLITCTCIYHENFKNMLEICYPRQKSISEFLKTIMCDNATSSCYFGICSKCPRYLDIDKLFDEFEEDVVSFYQWLKTDRTDCVLIEEPKEAFLTRLKKSIPVIMKHHYVTKLQGAYIKDIKERLIKQEKSIMIMVDFGQNYSFIINHAVQGYHWNNQQATIHPFVVYRYDEDQENVVYKTYFVISNELKHDAVTFQAFLNVVMDKVTADLKELDIENIYFVSDGASQHYKNRNNFYFMTQLKIKYKMNFIWHFTATAHGKSTCDAMSAVVKRATRLESVKNNTLINAADKMYEFCKETLTNINLEFFYVTTESVSAFRNSVADVTTKTIAGSREFHYYKFLDNGDIEVKRFSASLEKKICRVTKTDDTFTTESENMEVEMGEYLCVVYNKSMQIGLVLLVDIEQGLMKLQFMAKAGKGKQFKWPEIEKIDKVPLMDLVTKISIPVTQTGRLYSLPDTEYEEMVKSYNAKKKRDDELASKARKDASAK